MADFLSGTPRVGDGESVGGGDEGGGCGWGRHRTDAQGEICECVLNSGPFGLRFEGLAWRIALVVGQPHLD